ncbi:EpsG family protein [Lactococcus fujiensis]|uniref:EpsG family protein n=1 Tax=Lactococcus fujiensis JCM 16395 TaxID=1291764 RepID=A0A2A5RPS9_9LACT|nr:EpsG family protein [Lactococcus fujiensis]PCS01426.1 hypothetical protein RT41_GL000190 [Lactococcus fujiensis JCM 16395]
MFPYIICFAFALFFSALSEKYYRLKNKFVYLFFASAAVLSMSILAGIRDLNIGGDLSVYGIKVFTEAYSSLNISQLFTLEPSTEFGYLTLNYLISRITSNMNVFLFIFGLLTYGITYIALVNFRKYSNVTLSLFTYLMLFYELTFNLLRQGFACTLVFFAISLYLKGKKKLCLMLLILSVTFHATAILGFVVLFIVVWLQKEPHHLKTKLIIIFLFLFVMITVFSPMIIEFLINNNLIADKYTVYTMNQSGNTLGGISITNLYRLIFIVPFILMWHKIENNKVLIFLFMTAMIDFLFLFIGGTAGQVMVRLAYFFSWFNIIGYLAPIRIISDRSSRNVWKIILIFTLCIVFINVTLKANTNIPDSAAYYPYTSTLLNIRK